MFCLSTAVKRHQGRKKWLCAEMGIFRCEIKRCIAVPLFFGGEIWHGKGGIMYK